MNGLRVLLIGPTRRKWDGNRPRIRKAIFPPHALPVVAALTPPEAEVRISDEEVEEIDFRADVDLVGITTTTATAPRAYEIADAFRARGVKVCLGGIHASARPQEAARHADAVVIGEAEELWPQVVRDCQQGQLKQFYRHLSYPSLDNLPLPRRDLLKRHAYAASGMVQTTRGCPHACTFCSVTTFFGRTYRTRPVEQVAKEVVAMSERALVFVDDNLLAMPDYGRRLFTALEGCGKVWIGQASLAALRDRELLRLAYRAGCRGLFVGFESVSADALRRVGKHINRVAQYKEAVALLHDLGIGVIGSFMFGLDGEGEDVFEQTLRFVEEAKVDVPQFSILTPLPGTPLSARFEREGRIIDRDWSHYNGGYVVFRPTAMTPERLYDNFICAYKHVYSLWGILKRLAFARSDRSIFGRLNLGFRARLKAFLYAQ